MLPATFKDYLLLHFIVLIWGITSILGLLISLPSLELVFYRTLLAAIAVAVLMGMRKESFRVAPMDLIKIIGVGVLISLHWIFFFGQQRYPLPLFASQAWLPPHFGPLFWIP